MLHRYVLAPSVGNSDGAEDGWSPCPSSDTQMDDNDPFIDDLASFFADLYAPAAPLDLARAVLKAAFDAHNDAVTLLDAELDAERARLRAANADLSELLAVQAAGASRSPNSALHPIRPAATPQLDDCAKAPWPSPDASPERPLMKLRLLRSSASPARTTRRATVPYPSPAEPDRGERGARPQSAVMSIGAVPPPDPDDALVPEPPSPVSPSRSPASKAYAESSAIIDAYFPDTPSPKAAPSAASARSRSMTTLADIAGLERLSIGGAATLSAPSQLSSPLDIARRPLRGLATAARQQRGAPSAVERPSSASGHPIGPTSNNKDAPFTPPSCTTAQEGEQFFWQSQLPPVPKVIKQRPCSLQLDLLGASPASSSGANGFDTDGPLTPRPRVPASTPPSAPATNLQSPRVVAARTDELSALHEELAAQRAALAKTEAALVRAWDRAEVLADERAEADADLQTARIELVAAQHVLDGERRVARRELEALQAELQATHVELQGAHSEVQASRAELQAARFELRAQAQRSAEEPTTPRRHSFAIGERASPERTRQCSMKWLGAAGAQPALLAKIEEEEGAELDSELAAAHECIAQLEARVERDDREGRRIRAELDAAVERVGAVEKELDVARGALRTCEAERRAGDTQLESVSGAVVSLQEAQRLNTQEIALEELVSQELTDRIRALQDELCTSRRELNLRAAELDACSVVLHESYMRLIDAGRLLAEKDVQIAVLTADWLSARCDAFHADALLMAMSAG